MKRAKKKSEFDGEKKNSQLESAKSTVLEGVMKSEPNKLFFKKKKKNSPLKESDFNGIDDSGFIDLKLEPS